MALLEDTAFPLRENCDPMADEEQFVWMLAGGPGMKGAPLSFPVRYLKKVSRRMSDCGAVSYDRLVKLADENGNINLSQLHPPTIKYRPPVNTDPHWLISPGSWVDVNEPEPEQVFNANEFVARLPLDTRRQLAEALGLVESQWKPPPPVVDPLDAPPPDPAGATVTTLAPPFDPTRRTVKEVLAHLLTADEVEIGRVKAIEQHFGKARKQILRYGDTIHAGR